MLLNGINSINLFYYTLTLITKNIRKNDRKLAKSVYFFLFLELYNFFVLDCLFKLSDS